MRKVMDLNFLYNDTSDENRALLLKIVDKIRKTDVEMANVRLISEPDDVIKPDTTAQFDSANNFLNVADLNQVSRVLKHEYVLLMMKC